MKKNIGIFGGTFNPIHNAHLSIAKTFTNDLNLDICYFVPAYISPFRLKEAGIISPDLRVKMVELAIAHKAQFQTLDYEIKKAQTSFTIDTVLFLKDKFENDNLFLLIGGDQAESFIHWKDYKEILSNVQLCIAQRPDFKLENETINNLSLENKKPILIHTQLFDISASYIRESIKHNKNVNDFIPKIVLEFILANKLYK